MTEPFCPATILLTRPAAADYEQLEGGTGADAPLTLAGRTQARALAHRLVPRRIALVYSSPAVRAVQTAEIAAAVLGCAVRVRPALSDVDAGPAAAAGDDGCPLDLVRRRWQAGDLRAATTGGESGVDVLARLRAQFEQIADEHRGETVLVVGHGLAAALAVARLARNLAPDSWATDPGLAPAEAIELVSDADGLRALTWAGRPVEE